jgi:hypothetical protein
VAVFAPSSAIQHSATCSRLDYYSSMPSSPNNQNRLFGTTPYAFQDANSISSNPNSPRYRGENTSRGGDIGGNDRRSEMSNSISGSAFCSNSDLLGPQISDLHSRVIVTADFEGCIRVFVRTS